MSQSKVSKNSSWWKSEKQPWSELTSAMSWPVITACNSHCSSCWRKRRGAGDWSTAAASRLTAICVWSTGQTSSAPAECGIFCKCELKSGFTQRNKLVRHLSLFSHSLFNRSIGILKETQRFSKNRCCSHFHTLFYLVKVFVITLLILWMDREGASLVACILHRKVSFLSMKLQPGESWITLP